jgi:tripartite-type tricarboxylate transporter receptor subunit TctC
VALALAVASGFAYAQPVVKVVVGGPPGGLFDIAMRIVLEHVGKSLDSTVIVDNKPGAGGAVALASVRSSPPDGRTVAMVNVAAAANESIIANRGYSLLNDFEPVGMYAYPVNVLIVNPAFKARSVAEFVDELKGRSGPTNYASGGIGSPGHLAGELFKARTGVALTHVPYKGAPPAVLAVVTGEVGFMFATASAAIGQVHANKVRALAVTTAERLAQIPEVPTMKEAGFGDFNVSDWMGFLLPKGTPPAVRDRLHAALQSAFQDPQLREKLSNATFVPATKPLGPAEFGAFLRGEVDKWARVVKMANISPQ